MGNIPPIPKQLIDLIADELAKGLVKFEHKNLDPELAEIFDELFKKLADYAEKNGE